nr:hypothetical protein [Tanacetum cinerariifolium]
LNCDAYKCDKISLDTYRDTVTLKRRRDDADKDEEPSARSDQGSKRRREGKEPESISIDSLFESTHRVDVPVTNTVVPLLVTAPTLPLPSIPIMSQFTEAVSSIPGIVDRYIDHRMNEAIKVAVKLQSDRLRDKAQAENEDFINKLDKNIQKIIKAQVKEDTVTLKRCRDDADKDEEPSARSDRGSKRRREGKEPESISAPKEKASKTTDTLIPELLAGPTYELMKGSCKSLVELEFFLEEVYKATTDQLDWNNPEGQQYPHNLLKPLPLIPNSRGRRIIPFDHFIKNDLEYLRGGASSRKYTTFVTKTKVADYGYIKWIEDLVPRTMWSQAPVSYDKYALWGISHWGCKRQQFYGFAVNRESARDVYSKRRIIAVTEL